MRHRLLVPVMSTCALVVVLAACHRTPDAAPAPDTDTPAARALDPALAAGSADAAPDAAPPVPPAPSATPGVVAPTFAGFGPAAFGADAEAIRQAWGRDMQGQPPATAPGEAEGCYLLTPTGARTAEGRPALSFMIEGGRFVRADVRDTASIAPGGGRVGMPTADIERLHAGGIERQPHKYVDGAQYLRVRDAASGHVLVFETDAAGTVITWRIGQTPQVDYVESCS